MSRRMVAVMVAGTRASTVHGDEKVGRVLLQLLVAVSQWRPSYLTRVGHECSVVEKGIDRQTAFHLN